MDSFMIALEPGEQRLLEGLEFDVHKLDYDTFQPNATRARDLAKALAARAASRNIDGGILSTPTIIPAGAKSLGSKCSNATAVGVRTS